MHILCACVFISNYVEICCSVCVIGFLMLSCISHRRKFISVYFLIIVMCLCMFWDLWFHMEKYINVYITSLCPVS